MTKQLKHPARRAFSLIFASLHYRISATFHPPVQPAIVKTLLWCWFHNNDSVGRSKAVKVTRKLFSFVFFQRATRKVKSGEMIIINYWLRPSRVIIRSICRLNLLRLVAYFMVAFTPDFINLTCVEFSSQHLPLVDPQNCITIHRFHRSSSSASRCIDCRGNSLEP